MELLKHMIIDQSIYTIKLIRLEIIIILANVRVRTTRSESQICVIAYEENHAFDYLKDSDKMQIRNILFFTTSFQSFTIY